MDEFSENAKPSAPVVKRDLFFFIVSAMRWLLIPYVIALVWGGFLALAIASYGLAHGSFASNAGFLALVGLAMLCLGIPPLALLFRSQTPGIRGLQFIGMLVMCLGIFQVSRMAFHLFIAPQTLAENFQAVVKPITIESVVEAPYLTAATGKTPIGLRVTANVRLPNEVPLDRYGEVVLKALERSLYPRTDSRTAPHTVRFERYAPPTVTLNGQALDTLAGMKDYRALPYGTTPDGSVKLPAGLYQVSQVFLLPGLRRQDERYQGEEANTIFCKVDSSAEKPEWAQSKEEDLAAISNAPLGISMGESMSLGGRRGYEGFSRSAPMTYRYQHAEWKKTLAALPFESCKVFDDAAKARQEAADAAKKTEDDRRSYDSDSDPYQKNPLYAEACAGDVDKIRARIAAEQSADGQWVPRFDLSDIIGKCAITPSNLEVFKLLTPALYARASDKLGNSEHELCKVLTQLHAYRKLPLLAALAEQGLALDCPGQQLWLNGLLPLTEGVEPYYGIDAAEKRLQASVRRSDNVTWVKFLRAQKIDLCQSRMMPNLPEAKVRDMPPLLSRITPHFGADMIEAVLDAGCDPHALPPMGEHVNTLNAIPSELFSPAVVWMLRRHKREYDYDVVTLSLKQESPARLAKLDRMMMPTASELNTITPPNRNPLLVTLARRVIGSPPSLLAALVKAGAKPSAGLPAGRSWFFPFHGDHVSGNNDQHKPAIALMEVLNDAQLKDLINSPGPHIEDAAKTLSALERSTHPDQDQTLRNYVCKRKVLICD